MTEASPPTELTVDPADGTGRTPRSIALIAAVVLVVVAGAVAAAFALGGDDDKPSLGSETPTAGAERLWGNRYQVVSTVEKTGAEPWTPPSDPALTVTFDVDRRVSFTGCNGGSGTAAPGDERIVVDDVVSTMMACVDADGQRLMDHDEWMAGVLQAGVDVEGSADEPVLRGAGGAEVRLRLLGPAPEPPAPVEDPDAPVSHENPAAIDPTQLEPGQEPGDEPAADPATDPNADPNAIDPTELEPGQEPGTADPTAIMPSTLDPDAPPAAGEAPGPATEPADPADAAR